MGANTSASFTYNSDGDRLTENVNGVAGNFTLDLNTGITQVLSDGTHSYIYGIGRIAQAESSSITPYTITRGQGYFLGDALGSVRQLTDTQARVTLSKAYAPYGDVISTIGNAKSEYGFTGEM